jgi:succinyl-diaminopimelate desuccinylase
MISNQAIHRVLGLIDAKALIELACRLVRINSVWDPSAGTSEQAVAEYVADWARARGFSVKMEQVAPGRPNVIITWKAGAGTRCLMFEGHTDVVTPGDISAWASDPFGARIQGRRMVGRGANDTKGNLAAMLMALHALKQAGLPLSGTLIAGVLCDEEDGMSGVLDFIRRGHADKIHAAVICEPQDGLLCTCQKGAIRASFTIAGRMSHGAMPLSGLNTAPAVAALIQGLANMENEAIAACGQDPQLGWPSFTPTVIQAPASGAAQLNVIPAKARLLVDIRTLPSQSHEVIVAGLDRLAHEVREQVTNERMTLDRRLGVQRDGGLAIALEILTDRPCTHTDPGEPIVTAAHWATHQVCGKPPVYAGVPGATDGTFLWALKKIPIVTMGAGDRQVPHQVDEWVDLDQLTDMARIYALTALHYLSQEAVP